MDEIRFERADYDDRLTDLSDRVPEFVEACLEDLAWFGFQWDEGPFFQSERMELYREALLGLVNTSVPKFGLILGFGILPKPKCCTPAASMVGTGGLKSRKASR